MLTNYVGQLLETSREGVGTFREFRGHSSWLGIHKPHDPVKVLKARMQTSGAAIKAAPSVRPSLRIKHTQLLTMIQHLIQQTAKSILNNLFLMSLLHVSLTNNFSFIIHYAICLSYAVSSFF